MREYRNYRITPLGTRSGYVIQAKGQGTIPDKLKGEYTTPSQAKIGIDLFFATLSQKGRKKNAKEPASSTG